MCIAPASAVWISWCSAVLSVVMSLIPSIEYWFRCMDLDGDGVLSMYELEYFYEEQCERMEVMGIEPLPFHDLLCQMLDLVKPEREGKSCLMGVSILFDLQWTEKVTGESLQNPSVGRACVRITGLKLWHTGQV